MGDREWTEITLEKLRGKMDWVSDKNRGKIPYTTGEDGSYRDMLETSPGGDAAWWTNGFWPGLMWLLYQDTEEEKYAQTARIAEEQLEHCLTDYYGLHHDVGFMYLLSAGADYLLTGRRQSRRTALHAASLLAGRFNPAGRFIRAWNDSDQDDTRGWAIIDCMMNLSLLYRASEETKDLRFRNIAMAHADTAMQYFVRPDGSVNHIVEFDPETGRMVRSYGGQGYADGSSWTRGHAWAVYGFTISYRHTGKPEYLKTAEKVARYCIAHLPESGLMPVDFCQPAEPAWEDSCAACILACGLLELSALAPEEERAEYRNAALKLLHTIAEKRADFGPDCDAIVQNCSEAYHTESHHMTMVYADYFFAEALYKLAGTGLFLW